MFISYLKVAIRTLIRQKQYALINSAGLAIGLAVCLMIIGFISNELGFESCHEFRDRIYRVDGYYRMRDSGVSMACIMPAFGPAVADAFPEIDRVVRIRRLWDVPIEFDHEEVIEESKVLVAEPNMLKIFTLPLNEGDPETALDAPFSVIISDKIRRNHFRDEDPIGKTIKMEDEYEVRITGVFDPIPANTQLRSNFLVSYSTLERLGEDVTSWTELFMDYTYVLLHEDADPARIEEGIPAFLKQHIGPEEAKKLELQLQPLPEIYLNSGVPSGLSYELPPSGELTYIYVFGSIALLVLIVACINFVNLATARTAQRMKEVGVRKVLGAARAQLVRQFLIESVLLTIVSMAAGLVLFELARFQLEAFLERELAIEVYSDPILILSMLGMILIVGGLSGSYPALVLSRYQPSAVLRGGISGKTSKSTVRRVLVAFQFTIAISLMCATSAIYEQINFSQTTDLGFDNENILLIECGGDISPERRELLRDEIVNGSGALSATLASSVPGRNRWAFWTVRPENKLDADPTMINCVSVDEDYLSVFDIEVVEGRGFSKELAADSRTSIMMNETAVKSLGVENPIGFKIHMGDDEWEVIGVVKDYHLHSFQHEIQPTLLITHSGKYRVIAVKLPDDNIAGTVSGIEDVWNRIVPGVPMEYAFLEDAIRSSYETEHRIGTLFGTFSVLAVVVACLGLFGLAACASEQRTKEIGIRKVLGASIANIVRLLFKELLVLVVVANVIAWPLAYYVINRWLEDFAYRMDIGWTIFASSGILAFVIALVAVGYQALKAATANPVDTLKYE